MDSSIEAFSLSQSVSYVHNPNSRKSDPKMLSRCRLAPLPVWPYHIYAATVPRTWSSLMTWKTPKIVEVPVGMEINMYACAARK